MFTDKHGIDQHLSFSLQFSSITEEHAKQIKEVSQLPSNIASYISEFDESISDEEFNSPQYAYRVLYLRKIVNKKGQADEVIEFLSEDSPEAQGLNKAIVHIRDREKPKFLPGNIVKLMKEKGFSQFSMSKHADLWRERDAKNPAKGFGVQVATTWYWYDNWLSEVENHCKNNSDILQ